MNYVIRDIYRFTDSKEISSLIMKTYHRLLDKFDKSKIHIVPTQMFSFFYLTKDDFDIKGDYEYEGLNLNRGKMDYF